MNVHDQRMIRWHEISLARKHFNGSCFLCGKSIITNRKRPHPHTRLSFVGFLYHHFHYYQGEPRRKNYPKGAEGTWQYKRDLLPFVAKYGREEFLLLDKGCHIILERAILKSRRFEQFPERLGRAVRMTDTLRLIVKIK